MVFPHDTPGQAEIQGIERESDFSRPRAQFENEEIMSGFQELLQKYLSEFCNVEKKTKQIAPPNPNLKTLTCIQLPAILLVLFMYHELAA